MKKLKKFAALLLVGVMALALLTACGGGGDGMVTKKTEEDKVVGLIGNQNSVAVANDSDLRAVAEWHLNMDRKNLDAKFKIAGYLTAFKFHSEKMDNDRVIPITARYDSKDTLLNEVLKQISEHVDTDHNVNVNQDGDWTKVGVVVKGNNEQSYIGISIRIKNIYK